MRSWLDHVSILFRSTVRYEHNVPSDAGEEGKNHHKWAGRRIDRAVQYGHLECDPVFLRPFICLATKRRLTVSTAAREKGDKLS
jgi:hypothetical protein